MINSPPTGGPPSLLSSAEASKLNTSPIRAPASNSIINAMAAPL